MSKRGDKRRKRKVRSRSKASPKTIEQGSPRPVRMVEESIERLANTGAGLPIAARVEEAEALVLNACRRIAKVAEPFDAFDVVEMISRIERPGLPETYRETEHEGSLAAIELICQVVSARGHREGSSSDKEGLSSAVQELSELGREAMGLGGTLIALRTTQTHGGDGDLSIGPLLREVALRNVAFPHMLRDTLDALFADREVESDCIAALGCTYSDISTVFDGISRLLFDAEVEYRNQITANFESVIELAQTEQPDGSDAARMLLLGAFEPLPGTRLTSKAIAKESGVELDRVAAVLAAFSSPIAEQELEEVTHAFFSGRSSLSTRPLRGNSHDGYVVPHPGLLFASVRAGIEGHLKKGEVWTRYSDRRGDFLEEESLRLLQAVFPTSDILASTKYFVPAKGREAVEISPQSFTGVAETDGLVIVDDVALIVEAKSTSLSPIARTGHVGRVKSDLRKIVSMASEQAERLRARIEADGGLRLRDDTWLDLTQVREIHSITVSLEDLSGYATVTSALIDAGLLTESAIPWAVSLHDLRIVCELCERPAEFLLYLRRRTNPDVTRWFRSMDELDYYVHFLDKGLFVEPDPQHRFEQLPELGPPTAVEIRRREQMQVSLLLSQTDPVDQWYFSELGLLEHAAPKPTMNTLRAIQVLVDTLHESGAPGWLRVGTTLLSGSSKLQKSNAAYPAALAKLVASDGEPHTNTTAGGSTHTDSFVNAWVVVPAGMPLTTGYLDYLSRYITAKKHQLQVSIGAVLVFREGDLKAPASMIYDNREPGPNADLDAEVLELGLQKFGSNRDDLLRKRKR